MANYEDMLNISPYSLKKSDKEALLTERLKELTDRHRTDCREYAEMLDTIGYDADRVSSYEDLPFLPVRLFKEMSLKSVPDEDIVKTMISSGTTGQKTSKIYLDRETSSNQQKTMVKIVSDFTGSSRMPMIIIDCPSVVKDRRMFSARGAGILGFSIFGSKKMYALDDDMHLNFEELKSFLENYKDRKVFLFGFTFMIWQYFYRELVRIYEETGEKIDLSDAVLIHGGGWKKLVNEAVSAQEFHDRLRDVCGLDDIHDYYGMVEQTGCIYMQCECGHLHASVYSDVIIRRAQDFSVADIGEKGIIQVVSAIPESYPGHSLLTEDEGVILGEDDCPCGRKGKYFKIFGRLQNAEIRGCSDTYAAESSLRQGSKNNLKDVRVDGAGADSAGADNVGAANVGVDNARADNAGTDNANADNIGDMSDGGDMPDMLSGIIGRMQFLSGDGDVLRSMKHVPAKEPFDGAVVEFLNDLSKELMTNPHAKQYPDVVSLGFWLRKSSVESLRQRFASAPSDDSHMTVRIGRGVAFHIAPSNVAVNFAYSLAAGLMTGNANIVRVPSKEFAQVDIISRAINDVLKEHADIRPYICLVRYSRSRGVNDILSDICDTRIVWGGDGTIEELRQSKLKPRACEVTFADRYSLALIDSDEYADRDDKDRIVSDFFNDTYLTDQNACTSPRVVVWTGSRRDEAKSDFWTRLDELAKAKYAFQPVMAVDKLTQMYLAAADKDMSCDLRLVTDNDMSGNARWVTDDNDMSCNMRRASAESSDNILVRLNIDKLTPKLMNYRGYCGYFYEFDCDDVMQLREFCDDTRCQTVGVLGDGTTLRPLVLSGIKGVDRIVKIGHTMDFDLNWDGYNLVERLTRTVTV